MLDKRFGAIIIIHMKKKIIISLLVLVLIGAGVIVYVNSIFLPVQLKQIVTEKAQQLLQRNVLIKEINFNLIHGIVVRDITIFRKDKKDSPFINIQEAHLSVPLPSILKNQKIIIPSVRIHNPSILLIHLQGQEWNFSDLLKRKPSLSQGKTPPFILGKISVENARLVLIDHAVEPYTRDVFENTNINLGLSLSKGIKFDLETSIPADSTFISMDGNYSIQSKAFYATISAEKLWLEKYMGLFIQDEKVKLHNVLINSGDIECELAKNYFKLTGNVNADAKFNIKDDSFVQGQFTAADMHVVRKDDNWDAKTLISSKDMMVRIHDDKTIHGDLVSSNLKIRYLKDRTLLFTGDLELQNADILMQGKNKMTGNIAGENLDFMLKGNDFGLNGNLMVRGADMKIGDTLSFRGDIVTENSIVKWVDEQFSFESPVELRESNISFQDKSLNGTFLFKDADFRMKHRKIKASADIEAIKGEYSHTDKLKIAGNPMIQLEFDYNPFEEKKLDYSGSVILVGSKITGLPRVDTVKDISGKITFKPDFARTDQINVNVQDTIIQLAGSLSDFQNPALDINASSKGIDIKKTAGLFPEYLKEYKISPAGRADIRLTYNGQFPPFPRGSVEI